MKSLKGFPLEFSLFCILQLLLRECSQQSSSSMGVNQTNRHFQVARNRSSSQSTFLWSEEMRSGHSKFDFGRSNKHCLETPKAYQRPLLSLRRATVSLLGCSCFLSLKGVMNGHMVDRTWSHSMRSRLHLVQDQQTP